MLATSHFACNESIKCIHFTFYVKIAIYFSESHLQLLAADHSTSLQLETPRTSRHALLDCSEGQLQMRKMEAIKRCDFSGITPTVARSFRSVWHSL